MANNQPDALRTLANRQTLMNELVVGSGVAAFIGLIVQLFLAPLGGIEIALLSFLCISVTLKLALFAIQAWVVSSDVDNTKSEFQAKNKSIRNATILFGLLAAADAVVAIVIGVLLPKSSQTSNCRIFNTTFLLCPSS